MAECLLGTNRHACFVFEHESWPTAALLGRNTFTVLTALRTFRRTRPVSSHFVAVVARAFIRRYAIALSARWVAHGYANLGLFIVCIAGIAFTCGTVAHSIIASWNIDRHQKHPKIA